MLSSSTLLLMDSLARDMREYREAQKREPDFGEIKEYNLTEDIHDAVTALNYHGGVYSENKVDMTAKMYWSDIIRAKIDVIGIVGGFELMQEICEAFDEYKDSDVYEYSSLFDSKADGLHGWTK